MLDALIAGFDTDAFCSLLRSKFPSFSESRRPLRLGPDFPWDSAEHLGTVKTLPGPNGLNMPLLVVVASLPEGQPLRERSSRLRQFNFARQVLSQAMAAPSPGFDGTLAQGLFVFHDDAGNFRLSLVFGKAEGTKLVWSTARRLSFHVEAGAGNKTFRDRMALPWPSFDKLREAFSVEKLTKEFYSRLFAWYQAAMDDADVVFPNDIVKNKEPGEVKSEQVIRLITRLMFVWFIKQKGLVPDALFDPAALKSILRDFNPRSGETYYRAILQNLFFATLNSAIEEREFVIEGSRKENEEHFGVKLLYRYAREFAIPESAVLDLFRPIPFLNGGLFECLDQDNLYFDGFSRRASKVAHVPNRLFFDPDAGLILLLRQYNFTVEENSPGDEEVALDPELLGKVFENLLGAYNPETKVAARNATGSFYTPREIVNYMVDESLKAHVLGKLSTENTEGTEKETDSRGSAEAQREEVVRRLFTDGTRPSDEALCSQIDAALVTAKILDPACGSGAFPMGVLLRMLELLRILRRIPDDDHDAIYDLKLQLIENCIYGGDIQCIAVQISKLRFFISLVCEQKPTSDPADNYGIHTLPNLETKFVAADSLIGLPRSGVMLPMQNVESLKKELWAVRHKHFTARSYREKKELRKEDKRLRAALAKALEAGGGFDTESARLMSAWDPYDQNTSAPFSDPEWMFNVRDGFDIVIGNPPYGRILSPKQDAQVAIQFPEYRSTRDAYVAFVLLAVKLLRPMGVHSFIVPSAWLGGPAYKDFRALLLRYRFSKIVSLPFDMFEAAYVDNVVYVHIRDQSPTGHTVNTFSYCKKTTIAEFAPGPWERVLQSDWLLVPRMKMVLSNAGLRLSLKLSSDCPRTLSDIIEMRRGVLFDKSILSQRRQGKSSYPYFEGDVYRYNLRHHSPSWVELGPTMKEYPKEDRWFKGPRILLRRLVNRQQRIMAASISEDCITNKNLYSILLRTHETDLRTVLALVNSSLLSRLYIDAVSQASKDDFPQVTIGDFLSLPLPASVPKELEGRLISLVDQVLSARRDDPSADTSAWEAEIDRLVYALYGLTDEEIAIVEQSGGQKSETDGRKANVSEEAGEDATTASQSGVERPASAVAKKKPAPRKLKPNLPPSLSGWD